MADSSHRHSTASLQNADACSSHDGAGPSHVNATLQSNLPFRQAFRQPICAPEPKIHDITERFLKASDALEVGQLVKDDYFTLFESIGAIEIMDPKMDSGFLAPGETLEDEYDTSSALLPEEIIGIMDQLLCYEMAWHTGYPLSQTLFTSVYIDRLLWPEPKTLEQSQFMPNGESAHGPSMQALLQVLRAYCLALIKGCDYVIAKITSRDYFEEEDFCTQTYNRVLFVSTPIDVFLRELDAAVEVMEDTDLDLNDALRSAIISRLKLRQDYLRALDLDHPLEQMSSSWSPVLSGMTTVKATHQLGQSVPGAFSTKMQRRLASTVPPRPIVEFEFKDALDLLQHLCVDCEEATRFIDLPQDPLEYQSFLWTFASRSPAPLAYSRSYLSSLLFHPEILNSAVSLPLADVKTLVFPSSPFLDPTNWTLSPPRNPLLPKPPRLQMAMLIDEFVDRTGQPYLDLWVALGQNRCRLRRMLTHVITAWDLLQADASIVDTDLASAASELSVFDQVLEFSLSTWVYHKKLWMIEKVILLGFEQDIYLPDEFSGMYLFLSLIVTRRRELLSRIQTHHHTRHTSLLRERRLRLANDVADAAPYLDSLAAEATGTAALSLALARFYTIAGYCGLLPTPARPFSSESLRYELRMKPFLAVQPSEVPPFEDFHAHTQPYGAYAAPDPGFAMDLRNEGSELWAEVDGNVRAAREAFVELKRLGAGAARCAGVERVWSSEVQSLLASCVALGVAAAGVKDAVRKAGSDGDVRALGIRAEIPESAAKKRYAEGWIVVKVVKQ
ncbi:amino-acid N-acetyltransferas-like protein subunit Mak10 [Boeremia exigua]|uniref:amino-acid N-acetyltransferase-like protein subunit Mak10 n=1 Tax=Boeremia exigua TaxID=749465 RepID=UPI001E8CE0AB|nr:amino-acid N-acetyltransferase-like protein subunit Mak10 [Boeremia exigua]KAH6642587.1 amino-acid N-acetyltransferas-like protein subunit Mak10 [Boeremia exigua]